MAKEDSVYSANVVHNESKRRFEVQVESHIAELTYTLQRKTILFTHTGVPSSLEGHGIGSRLVKAGLDYARAKKLKVKTTCWFVSGFLERHPEYQDLTE
jgi:predicted GNAT family acetyltransferase